MDQYRLEKGQYIRAICLMAGDELVAAQGGDMARLMPLVGLDPAVLKKPDSLVPFRAIIALGELCAAEFDMPDFGIRSTMQMEPAHPNVGPILALAHFTRTGREWFNDVLDYWAYHTNAFTFEILEDVAPGVSIFREVNHLVGLKSRQYIEHVMANIVAIARRGLSAPDENPSVVRFRHRKPKDISTHEAFFRCPIEFGCDHDELVFNTAMYDYETGGRLSLLRPVVRRYVQSRIDRLEFYDVGVATNVAMTIRSLIGTDLTDLASIADVMDVSPKKLQRLLATEGTSFSEVAEKVREEMAQEFLAQEMPQVGTVAEFLGYSGNSAFTLAFRKWTGMSPLKWRKSRLSRDQ